MMRTVYFYLTGVNKGKNVLLMNRYKFVNGVLAVRLPTADCDDHHKIASLLCRYHGCVMSDDSPDTFVFPEDKAKYPKEKTETKVEAKAETKVETKLEPKLTPKVGTTLSTSK